MSGLSAFQNSGLSIRLTTLAAHSGQRISSVPSGRVTISQPSLVLHPTHFISTKAYHAGGRLYG